MKISQLIDLNRIVLDIHCTSKIDLFSYGANLFKDYHLETQKIINALSERENMGSTGLGEAVAIPHGRVKNLKTPLLAFIRLAEPGLAYGAVDNKAVQLVFLLLVPENANQEHLEILSQIANLLANSNTRQQFFVAQSAQEILNIFSQAVF